MDFYGWQPYHAYLFSFRSYFAVENWYEGGAGTKGSNFIYLSILNVFYTYTLRQ